MAKSLKDISLLMRISAGLLVLAQIMVGIWHCPARGAELENKEAKPIIGINLDVVAGTPVQYCIQTTYVQAIREAGGLPVLLPPVQEKDLSRQLELVHGILMIGGNDYHPRSYGQKAAAEVVPMEIERENYDLLLAAEIQKRPELPFLGICAGSQCYNIAAGGTLLQDIPSHLPDSKVQHASPEGWQTGFNRHNVKIESNSRLSRLFQDSVHEVPTSHHQAVDKLGKNLAIAAISDDGVIEAIESTNAPFHIGVQWHPERDLKANIELFREFVARARNFMNERAQEQ